MSLKHLLRESIEDLKRNYVYRWKNNPNFKKWFGNSKVVDSKGDPLIVFHATSADFDSFGVGDIGYHFGTAEASRERIGVAHFMVKNTPIEDETLEMIDISNTSLPEYEEFFTDNGVTEFVNDIESEFSEEDIEIINNSLMEIRTEFTDYFESFEHFHEKHPTEKEKEKILKNFIALHMNVYVLNLLGGNRTAPKGRTGAYFLKIENPLITDDLKTWDDPYTLQDKIPRELFNYTDTFKNSEEFEELKDKWDGSMRIEDIKKYLMDLGYDGIKYDNQYEAKGSVSWIAFEPTQIKSIFNSGDFNFNTPNFME